MLSRLAESVYTGLYKVPPLKKLADRIILSLLPRAVRCGKATVVLNPADPVISGALLFRVYERDETRFLMRTLAAGDLFIDIGANVGYYTALAIHLVGSEGRVLAFEPDPTSFRYLERTIAANPGARAEAFSVAASARAGRRPLYVSPANRGDNRFHGFHGAMAGIEVETVAIDAVMESLQSRPVPGKIVVKIDVQGSEGLVVSGMRHTLEKAADLVLLMEFWPQGLENMQADPQCLLAELEACGLALYVLGKGGGLTRLGDKAGLAAGLPGRKYTNIVGLKGRPGSGLSIQGSRRVETA